MEPIVSLGLEIAGFFILIGGCVMLYRDAARSRDQAERGFRMLELLSSSIHHHHQKEKNLEPLISLGRQVRVFDSSIGEECTATVTKVHGEPSDGLVNLHVLNPTGHSTFGKTSIVKGSKDKPNTWYWPPRD